MHRLETDQVIVIQHQRPLAGTGPGGQLVDQRRYQPLERHPGQAGRSAGSPARRSPGTHGPARLAHGARSGPGRCHRHPATATRPGTGRAGPNRPAELSCRTRPGHIPGSGPAPAPHRAAAPGAAGTRNQAAARARAAWRPAAHPAPPPRSPTWPPRAAQSMVTCTLTASSHPSCGDTPIVAPGRYPGAAWNRRGLPRDRPEGFGVPEAPPPSGAGRRCPARGRPRPAAPSCPMPPRRFHPQGTFR